MPRRIDLAEFVISAVSAADLPRDGRPEVALVGRSNVGKSTLINALVRKPIARTSATPGRTRQVNVYRVASDARAPGSSFYLVDLPGYGHTSGGEKAREEFAAIIATYFDSRAPGGSDGHDGVATREASPPASPLAGCVLAIDARHPGLASDAEALRWLSALDAPSLLVATKADKLSQSERARLRTQCEKVFGRDALVVSGTGGDGLDELWKTIRGWTS